MTDCPGCDELFKIKQKVVIANRELREKLAEAEADLDWISKNPAKILCFGGATKPVWEYCTGGKGTRHDPWTWSSGRYPLREAIRKGRELDGSKT